MFLLTELPCKLVLQFLHIQHVTYIIAVLTDTIQQLRLQKFQSEPPPPPPSPTGYCSALLTTSEAVSELQTGYVQINAPPYLLREATAIVGNQHRLVRPDKLMSWRSFLCCCRSETLAQSAYKSATATSKPRAI